MQLLDKPKFRGERCHNPFNIDESKNNWVGKSDIEIDSRLEEFTEPVYGVRAGIKLLNNYITKKGLNTINLIFDRYAPPNENDTEGYKRFVPEKTGLGLDEPIEDFQSIALVFAKTVIKMEQGRVIYPDEMIQQAIDMVFEA